MVLTQQPYQDTGQAENKQEGRYLNKFYQTLPLHQPCVVCNTKIVYKYQTCSKECHGVLISSKLKGKGNNYLISESGALMTFDAAGFFYKFDKDAATKNAVGFGGNFFTVRVQLAVSASSDNARIANIKLPYLSKWQ